MRDVGATGALSCCCLSHGRESSTNDLGRGGEISLSLGTDTLGWGGGVSLLCCEDELGWGEESPYPIMMSILDVKHAAKSATIRAVMAVAIYFSCVCHIHSPRVEEEVSSNPAHRGRHMRVGLTPAPFSFSSNVLHHQWYTETSCHTVYLHS